MTPPKVTDTEKTTKSSSEPLSPPSVDNDVWTNETDNRTSPLSDPNDAKGAGSSPWQRQPEPFLRQNRNKSPFSKLPRESLPSLMDLSFPNPVVRDRNNNSRGILNVERESIYVPPPMRNANRFDILFADSSVDQMRREEQFSTATSQVLEPTTDARIEQVANGELLENETNRFAGSSSANSSSSSSLAANDSQPNLDQSKSHASSAGGCSKLGVSAWASWESGGIKFSNLLQSQYQSMVQQRKQQLRYADLEVVPVGMETSQSPPTSEKGTAQANSQSPSPDSPEAQSLIIPGGLTVPPAIILNPLGAAHVKPSLFVVPFRAINFTSIYIQFTIQVFNLPPHASVTHQMFEVLVETPSGKRIQCSLKKDPPSSVFGGGAPALETFVGSFRASEEVGLYNLRARMVLPLVFVDKCMARFHSDFGVAGDAVDILVSRNYFKDSKKTPGVCFQLNLKSLKDVQPGENALSSKAWGLTCDKQTNRLYFTERAGNRISCIEPNGRLLFQFDQTSTESRLNKPTGICCDAHRRRVLICDKDNHRVCFFTMDGQYISSFGTHGYKNGFLNYPWDLDVSPDGSKIVVADSRNKRIQLFDSAGNFISKFSVYEQNPFEYKKHLDYPRGICFDSDGLFIYVTDFNTQNVIKVPSDFSSSRRLVVEGKIMRPQGIAVDDVGGLLVADSKNNCVYNLSSDGQVLSVIRSVGVRLLQYPVNLTVLSSGHVAVLDGKGRIHIF